MPNSFQKTYQNLNPAQRKAVDAVEGPVIVLAGPGTGKTHVLAARVANILKKTDADPGNILALTFTESAATNMKERLVRMVGPAGYYVQVNTFHSFCSQVIQTHPEYFPVDRNSESLSDLERYDIFERIILELDLEVLKPLNKPLFYLKDIIKAVSELKREGVGVEKFREIVHEADVLVNEDELTKAQRLRQEKIRHKHKELSTIYAEYEKRLRASLRYDYDDMVALVVRAFEEEELLLREYQETLQYLLVDEYQDTNTAQNKIVDLLASYWGEQANVFVVGDPHQSIYRFQGALLENVLDFSQRYPLAEVITLTTGYRSTQTIHDLSFTLLESEYDEGDEAGKPVRLESVSERGEKIEIITASSETVELITVAEKIKDLLSKGTAASEIAVLFRTNREAEAVKEVLDKWEIACDVNGKDSILKSEPIRQLITFFEMIASVRLAKEDERLFEVMGYEWLGLKPLLVMQVARAAGKAKCSIISLIQQGYKALEKYHPGPVMTELEFSTLEDFISRLLQWGVKDSSVTFPEWFEVVISESGYLEWVLAVPNKAHLLTQLTALFNQVKTLSKAKDGFKLSSFLSALDTMRQHGIQITAQELSASQDAVHLSTVHSAKGLEWEYVFLINLVDKHWGNRRVRNLLPLPDNILEHSLPGAVERNAEERRLFYVGLTRAKTQVFLSRAQEVVKSGRTKKVVGSIFLEELKAKGKDLIKQIDSGKLGLKLEENLGTLITPAENRNFGPTEKEYFTHLVKDFKLSVTALNTYLRDTQKFVENFLLRIPRAKPEPMAFGTAVHVALEKFYKKMSSDDKKPALDYLTTQFQFSLKKELMTSDNFKRRLRYGTEILSTYYGDLNSTAHPVFIERFFGFGGQQTVLGDIPLTGRIDRIDWLDKTKKTVQVIDYKTGRARSIGDIEGKTVAADLSEREQSLPENIRGPYKRQLLFYKLLTELDRSFKPVVKEGVFSFVEPDKRTGKLINRSFMLDDEAVQDLKDLIQEVMGEIRGLGFLG